MKRILLILICLSLFGCASTGMLTPMKFNTNDAEELPPIKVIREIPLPKDGKPIVAVYSFRDLTGQRKQQIGVASFTSS
jgi:hypothetical protein